jgi:putative transposase
MYTNQLRIICRVFVDFVLYLPLCVKPSRNLAAENLFLRKQLALFQERKIKFRSTDPATRLTMAFRSQRFNWRDALVIVQPRTLLRWHRHRFQELWRRKSQPGRPPISPELQRMIRRMATENFTWGEERIANELLVELGISVSPRTIRKYMPKRSGHRGPRGEQTWATFLKNHADAIIACDFCIVVTMNFRVLYVFVLIEHGTRQLNHTNVTENPTADWARQQLREAIPSDHEYQYLIHDGDCIFSAEFDRAVRNLGIKPINSSFGVQKAHFTADH